MGVGCELLDYSSQAGGSQKSIFGSSGRSRQIVWISLLKHPSAAEKLGLIQPEIPPPSADSIEPSKSHSDECHLSPVSVPDPRVRPLIDRSHPVTTHILTANVYPLYAFFYT